MRGPPPASAEARNFMTPQGFSLETPTVRTLPAFTRSSSASRVSSKGVMASSSLGSKASLPKVLVERSGQCS